jgi:multiple sugar transport system substrate-binding protein
MTAKPSLLRGITWNHSRAYPPLVATAQRFEELNPGLTIQWERRSLHAFGHANVAELASEFDLVVMDHPWCGYAVEHNVFVNLRNAVAGVVQDELKNQSLGPSYASYEYRDQLVGLPIDGATPVSSFRPDLIPQGEVPKTWDDLTRLARGRRVVFSAFHVDLLLHLIMLAATLKAPLFLSHCEWAATETLRQAMDMLRQLACMVPQQCLDWNPIAVYEALTRTDDFVYCPFAYGYSNYARRDYARRILQFTDLVEIPGQGMLRSVLGGTGIALSEECMNREGALAYLVFVSSGEVQRSLYVESGGQPAHRSAWLDDRANSLTGDFFRSTLRSMENAYIRPRYNGYLHFQENAGQTLVAWLRGEMEMDKAIEIMNRIYRESRSLAQTTSGMDLSQEN